MFNEVKKPALMSTEHQDGVQVKTLNLSEKPSRLNKKFNIDIPNE